MCRGLASEPVVSDVAAGRDDWDLPLRILAALHFLQLSEGVDPWEEPAAVIAERAGWISRFVTEQGVQTNEVQRSWLLLPCFLELARRAGAGELDLIELGSSAGLNLVWDRYRYRYAHAGWGDADAPLELGGEERRAVPEELLRGRPRVRSRVGIDRRPIDVTADQGALLLKSFVWADQTDRLQRLDRAIEALRRDPPELRRGDLVEVLPQVLEQRAEDVLTIVFETAVLGYIAEDGRAAVFDALERSARENHAPLGLVRSSQPPDGSHMHWGIWIRLWPEERQAVALANFHGAWLEWLL